MVISILIISGPAKAITLGITDISDATPDEQTDVSFLAKVDIHTPDVVPLTNITINIKNADNSVNASCTFYLNGTKVHGTSDAFTVQKLSGNANYTNPLAGYGYGYTSTGYLNQSFGYGYQYLLGYGYDAFNTNIESGTGVTSAEFIYNITWTTPDISSDTTFNIEMLASADDGSHSATFKTKTPTEITVQVDTPAPTTPGGGSSSGTVSHISVTSQGTSITLRKGFVKTFMLGNTYHTIKGVEIGADYATFQITSTPTIVTLALLESKNMDFDNDGYYDLYIRLDEIKNNQAYLTLKQIHESITAEAEEEPETPEETPEEQPGEQPEETPEEVPPVEPIEKPPANLAWLWILVVLIIIGLASYFFIYKKKEY